jgi:hypothetical protein
MMVDTLRCSTCSIWIVIEPLEIQGYRTKHCDCCEADFWFENSELTRRDIPEPLASRGYFTDLELALKPQAADASSA